MLDQAPAPSCCVSPRLDTLICLRPEIHSSMQRLSEGLSGRLPLPRAAIPPSTSLGSRLWRLHSTRTGRLMVEEDTPPPPPRADQSQQKKRIKSKLAPRSESRPDNCKKNRKFGPPLRISYPRHVRCGGRPRRASSLGSTSPCRGPQIPPTSGVERAPVGNHFGLKGVVVRSVGLGGGVRVDGPRSWACPRGRLRGWGLGGGGGLGVLGGVFV